MLERRPVMRYECGAMPKAARREVRTGRLRAADPFELIRWLARSQTDPRKALAELVQNSLDAAARTVTITRVRERGAATLHVHDDGEGIIPELPRPEALAYIATHIGHSRKRNLTPEQRRELLLQGQYGIGLLGFWSIGAELEVRSQLSGDEPWALRMWEEINGDVDALVETGIPRRVLALVEVAFSTSMIAAWWRSLRHQWLY
jgi:hypothetical protein